MHLIIMSKNAEPRRILIVDDEPTILLTLSYALRSKGVEVVTASRLETAEEALERYPFDLVIADIRMSGILGVEGLELLSYIKRYWPETKVIIMTAYGSDEIRQDAYERGANYYYDKPVDITELARRVHDLGIPVAG
jgi:two-component system response regulator (stage 0 sporulation protein F)